MSNHHLVGTHQSQYKKNPGYQSNLKHECYFPENGCMNHFKPVKCRDIQYPLENVPSCHIPCKPHQYPSRKNTVPSELYGDAVGMNEGIGLFYYHDPTPYPLGYLTKPQHNNPIHHSDPHHS